MIKGIVNLCNNLVNYVNFIVDLFIVVDDKEVVVYFLDF